jgi:hypothetical protein
MAGGHLLSFGVLAEELSGAEATRRVLLTSGALVLLGLALLIATVWWWRSTRPEHPVLAPLEVMGDRRWSKAGAAERRRLIDESRAAAKERAAAVASGSASSAPAPAAVPAAAVPVAALPAAGVAPVRGAPEVAAPAGRVTDAPQAEPERVDLSVLVRSMPVPDDLAEMDVLLGLAPAPAEPSPPQSSSARVEPAVRVDDPEVRVERVLSTTTRRDGEAAVDASDSAVEPAVEDDDVVGGADGGGRPAIDPLLQRTRD